MFRSIKKRISNRSNNSNGSDGGSDYESPSSLHSMPLSTSSLGSAMSTPSRLRRTPSGGSAGVNAKKFAAAATQAFTNVSSSATTSLKSSFQNIHHIPNEPDMTVKVTHLSKFDACVEAADVLAASTGHESKVLPPRVDEATGLSDCSVLVSPDGDLLLVPQGRQDHEELFGVSKKKNRKHAQTNDTETKETSDSTDLPDEKTKDSIDPSKSSSDMTSTSLFSELMLNGKDDYESAVFLGNDLAPLGDKSLNRFSAKGWSIPATSVALQQTEQSLQDLARFGEDVILAKKECAANTAIACDNLKARQPSMGGQAPLGDSGSANDWEIIDPRSHDFEMTARRVGPLLVPGSSLNMAVVELETYYATMSQRDAIRWREEAAQRNPTQKGCLPALRQSLSAFSERARNRQLALDEATQRARQMEERLSGLKRLAQAKWDAVFQAEDMVTKRVEAIMQERSRERERQRLQQLRDAQAQRATETGGEGAINTNTSSEEIWDIVSSVAESMEEGSFEPMDMTPTDQVKADMEKDKTSDDPPESPAEEPAPSDGTPEKPAEAPDNKSSPKSTASSVPMVSREQIEMEVGLPQLRASAMAADESIVDASDSLMNLLATLDTTRRSARVAAETSLAGACHAQAAFVKSIVKLERESLEEKLRALSVIEESVENIDVREELDNYITTDRKERGGSSHLGDDDDGGIASALAILSRHVDGSMGADPLHRMSVDSSEQEDDGGSTTAELLDAALEAIFEKDNPHFSPDAPESEEMKSARDEFKKQIDFACKVVSDVGPGARAKRSTVCYKLNSRRSSHAEIETPIQFESLCRIFSAILTGCNAEEGGVSNAKMCIMLAQTFYVHHEDIRSVTSGEDDERSARDTRDYVKSHLSDHPIWKKEDFW